MENFITFEYRSTPLYICTKFDKEFRTLSGAGVRHSVGFALLQSIGRHAVRAKLWLQGSLVQVNCVLDDCKPHGQVFVFDGDFFFCFLFFKVLNTFSFRLFSFEL